MPNLKEMANNLMGNKGPGKECNFFNLNLSGNFLKGENQKDFSLGTLANDLVGSIGGLNQIANMAYCIGEMIMNPDMLLGVLDNVANSMVAVATQLASQVVGCIEGQVNQALSIVSGTINNVTSGITNFLNSIVSFVDALTDAFENVFNNITSLFDIGKANLRSFLSQEDCTYMFSYMARCLLNKVVGDKITNFADNITKKITEKGQEFNTSLIDEFSDANNLGNFLNHESFMMNKATQQMSMFG